ncbi:hypothetical protein HG535_0E05750 [Zygotorulaspora mrakii]|uniref:Uncharacterized protein n=1 Tax=Zygotorulaspora mrakii TaxID=42260 RepID=A0A7H9B473_ZYGMR|nr:uncharacterized protein HG535_0E05750 [Zygotorulaspora mrakii]QLG73491.1 hypothetical protein HG535_0E05750 [Zygotorulaspora mrakii]
MSSRLAKYVNTLNTSSKCATPKFTIKTTTFPPISTTSRYSTVKYFQNADDAILYSKDSNASGKVVKPTVVISSDNEVETVSEHVRV